MVKRVISGIVLIIVAIVALLAPVQVRLVLVALLMIIASHEMLGALKHAGYAPLIWPSYVFSALCVPVYVFLGAEALWALMILLILSAFCQRVLSKKTQTLDLFSGLIVFIYPLVPFLFLLFTINLPDPLWLTVLLSALVSSTFTDVFALFTGMLFGKHPLSPISPKKTVEGAVGGFVFAVLGGILLYLFQGYWGAAYPLWIFLVAGAISSLAGQIGDLSASSIKRTTGIKDFGKLIPGHGGVLDRFDSILFTVPVAFIMFYYFS